MMPTLPLVSIVVNNYNYAAYIQQAIESALAQTYKNCEVIVVDDGSTDESRKIIKEYEGSLHVLLKANGGQASAFNLGIRHAKGDFILLLDSDDYLYPGAVETCVKNFPTGYSRVYFQLDIVDERSQNVTTNLSQAIYQNFDGDIALMLDAGKEFFTPPTTANFFRASMLHEILPIPENEFRICADAFVTVNTFLRGPVRSIEERLGAYRVHRRNNFFSRTRLLSDPRILRNRIDDRYRIPKLLEQAYLAVGRTYSRADDDTDLLELLCAGYKLQVDSPHIVRLTRKTLFSAIAWHAKKGPGTRRKRLRSALYLSLVLLTPRMAALPLLRAKDYWTYRSIGA